VQVIFFYCCSCKEELEAEDSIRGARMKCPACFKEIEVPQVGVRVPGQEKGTRSGKGADRDRKKDHGQTTDAMPLSEGRQRRLVVGVLVASVIGVFALIGVGYVLVQRAEERRQKARPRCELCGATGKIACAVCGGKRQSACKECNGSGRRKNLREEEEPCFACGSSGLVNCAICGGRGTYGCSPCQGTGFLDVPIPREKD
jgi:hypothetical protein